MKFIISFLFFFILLVALDGGVYAHGPQSYRTLRAALIRQGWRPLVTEITLVHGTLMKSVGDTKQMLDAGFSEIEYCSGVENNICIFNWKNKKNNCLRVSTAGELNSPAGPPIVVEMRYHSCPKPPYLRKITELKDLG